MKAEAGFEFLKIFVSHQLSKADSLIISQREALSLINH